jgi:hypothetical protein
MTDNKPRPTSEADLGNRLAAANWHLVKLVAGALVRSIAAIPNPDLQPDNVQTAAICRARHHRRPAPSRR